MEIIKNERYSNAIQSRNDKLITYFTPTYNRADYLPRVYQCLKQQSCNQFVWLVVDDGSKDNTVEVMTGLVDANEIPILFISKTNGGKHSAFEIALKETNTDYFACMDDDDIYSEEATRTFLTEWQKIEDDNLSDIIGAVRTLTTANGRYVSNVPIPDKLVGNRFDHDTLEYNHRKKIRQENWTCYKVSSLQSVDLFSHDYWLASNHKFFDESIWQGRFARKYKCRYVYVSLEDYRHDTEFSLVRANKTYQHYIDMFINSHMILNEQVDYIKYDPKYYLRKIVIVSVLRYKLSIPFGELLKHTKSKSLKISYCLLYPFTWLSINPKVTKDATYKKLY